jgi:hypothetical protein
VHYQIHGQRDSYYPSNHGPDHTLIGIYHHPASTKDNNATTASLKKHKDNSLSDGVDNEASTAPEAKFELGCEVEFSLGGVNSVWIVKKRQLIDRVWHYDLQRKEARNVPLDKLHSKTRDGGDYRQFTSESDVRKGDVVFYKMADSRFEKAEIVAVHPPLGEQHYEILLSKPGVEENRLVMVPPE